MNIVNLYCNAIGYYSDATYEENILISEDFYNKIASIFDENFEIYIADLDGKHSEVEGDFEVQHFKEEEIINAGFEDIINDCNSLYWIIKEKVNELGFDLDEEINKTKKFIDSIDKFINVTVRVKQSDKDKVIEFAKSLYE